MKKKNNDPQAVQNTEEMETFDLEKELGTEARPPEKHLKLKRVIALIIIGIILTVFVLVFIYVAIPMFRYAKNPSEFQEWIAQFGPWGKLVLFGMQVMQIVVAFIPGGPLEVVAGVAFGQWWALILCVLGAFVGDLIGFFLARILGSWVVHLFFSDKELKAIAWINRQKSRDLFVFIFFLVPGMPKDVLSYLMGLTNMKWYRFSLIALFARIPAILMSSVAGNSIAGKNYGLAIGLLVAIISITVIGSLVYRKIQKKHEAEQKLRQAADASAGTADTERGSQIESGASDAASEQTGSGEETDSEKTDKAEKKEEGFPNEGDNQKVSDDKDGK
ncbi:MAG: TVP38/TMEM64 family protein [Clostridia bacterium]|nr:TVP38/TMEM64 family protein [Clostridia bacterium]